MSNEPKKAKPTRLTVAPLYLAAGLAACFLVLTKMIPSLQKVADEKTPAPRANPDAWGGLVAALSNWVCNHQSVCITAFVVVAAAGFVLPLLIRPTRYLVWLAAVAIFFLDVALAASSWWAGVGRLLNEANNMK
jgi:hypothetical protein